MVKKAAVDKTEAYKQLEADREVITELLEKLELLSQRLETKIMMSYTDVKKINVEKIVGYLNELQRINGERDKAWSEYLKLDRRLDKISA